MPKTLLVVDDSATMRKVFELTFGGEDYNVVTHDGGDSVLARARDARPDAAVIDVNLGGPNGYDVVRALKGDAALASVPVLLLFSEQTPVDEGKVRDCGADGTLQKPFDTQACIDRLKQLLGGGAPAASTGAAASSTAAPPAASARPTTAGTAPPPPASKLPSSAGVGSVGATPAKPAKATQMFGPGSLPFGAPAAPSAPPARPAAPAPPPLSREPADIELTVDGEEEMSFSAPPAKPAAPAAPARPAPAAPAPARPAAPAPMAAPARPAMPTAASAPARPAPVPAASASPAAAISAEVGQRVAAMGLTPAQVEAVTALTREVVERVVWEVVPQLAETLIREEIRRLTAE